MATEKSAKRNAWKSILKLMLPYKKTLVVLVILSLLSTANNLIEPLVYREAVNDIAGLFVKQAKDETRKELGVTVDEDEPITSFVENGITSPKGDTLYKKVTIAKTKKGKKKRIKEPHTRTHVASRTPDEAIETLLWSVAILFTVNVFGYILWLIAENIDVKLNCRIEQNFIQRTFGHVLKLPLGFFSKRSSAAIAKQIDQAEEVTAVIGGVSQQILPKIISLTGIIAIMLYENVTLTLMALSVIPFFILIAWRSAKRLETGLSKYYERWEEVSARIQDALGGIKTVKLSGAELREVEHLQEIADQAYKDYIDRTRLGNKYAFWEGILTNVATALVLGYGGYLALDHKLTPGDVVMFVTYLDRLYEPIDSLSSLWISMQQNVASIARAFKLLDRGVEEKAGKDLIMKQGRIEFKNVHFGYTDDNEILKGLSFTIEPGKVTAMVGTSGAGKTTTVDLLIKLYEPQSGEILIDGQLLSDCDASSVRRQIGMVSADGMVFRGTLADNIRYKKPNASDEEVKTAAISAGMAVTIERLPDGLKTIVGESGFGLSVGERQRIQIARVLISKPHILILDEATANLDYATEAEVKKTIDEIRKENTVIIIAHRFSMVKDADHVIVLDEGQIAEEGTPDELIENGGWFTDFANANADDEEVEYEEEETEEESDDEDDEEEE
jgi:ABC-type multidrug transport system fused ATPase/permease subunit